MEGTRTCLYPSGSDPVEKGTDEDKPSHVTQMLEGPWESRCHPGPSFWELQ